MTFFILLEIVLLFLLSSTTKPPDIIISSEETFHLDLFNQFNYHDIPLYSNNDSCLQNLTFLNRNLTFPIISTFKAKTISAWLYFQQNNMISVLFDENALLLFQITTKGKLQEKASFILKENYGNFRQMLSTGDDNVFLLSFYNIKNYTNIVFFDYDNTTINLLNFSCLENGLEKGKIAINSGMLLLFGDTFIEIYLINNRTILKKHATTSLDPKMFPEKIVDIISKPCSMNYLDDCTLNPKFFITFETSFNRFTLSSNSHFSPDFHNFNFSIPNLQKVYYAAESNLYFAIIEKKVQIFFELKGKFNVLNETLIEFANNTETINLYYGSDYLALINSSRNGTNNNKTSEFFIYKNKIKGKNSYQFELFYRFSLNNSGFFFIENFGLIFLTNNDFFMKLLFINPTFILSITGNKAFCEGFLNFSSEKSDFQGKNLSLLIVPLDFNEIRVFYDLIKEPKLSLENHIVFEVNIDFPKIIGNFIQIFDLQSSTNEFAVKPIQNKTGFYNISEIGDFLLQNISGLFRISLDPIQTLEKSFKLASFESGKILLIDCVFSLLSLNLRNHEFSCSLLKTNEILLINNESQILQMELFNDGMILMLYLENGVKYMKIDGFIEMEFINAKRFELVNYKYINGKAFFVINEENELFFVIFQAIFYQSIVNISSEIMKNNDEKPKFEQIQVFQRKFKGNLDILACLALEIIGNNATFWFFTINTTFNSTSLEILQIFSVENQISSPKNLHFHLSRSPKSLIIACSDSSSIIQYSYNQEAFDGEFFSYQRKFPIPKGYSFSTIIKYCAILSQNDFFYIKMNHKLNSELLIYDIRAHTSNMLVWKFINLKQKCQNTKISIPEFANSGRRDIILLSDCDKNLTFSYFDNKVLYKLKDRTRSTNTAYNKRFLEILQSNNSNLNEYNELRLIVLLNETNNITLKFPYISVTYPVSTSIKFTQKIEISENQGFCLKDRETGHVFLNQIIDLNSNEFIENVKFHDLSQISEFFFSGQSLVFAHFAFFDNKNNFLGVYKQTAFNFSLIQNQAKLLTFYDFTLPFEIKTLTNEYMIYNNNEREFGLLMLNDTKISLLKNFTFMKYYTSSLSIENSMLYMLLKGKKGYMIRNYIISDKVNLDFFDFHIGFPKKCKFLGLQSGKLREKDDIIFLLYKKKDRYLLEIFFHRENETDLISFPQELPWFQVETQITGFSFIMTDPFNEENISLISLFCNTKQAEIQEISIKICFSSESYTINELQPINIYNHFPGCHYKNSFETKKIENFLVLTRICQNLDKEAVVFYMRNLQPEKTDFVYINNINISGSSPFFFRGSIKRVILKENPPKLLIFLKSIVISFNISLEGACFNSFTPGYYEINAMNLYTSVKLVINNATVSEATVNQAKIAYLALIGICGIVFFCLIGLVVYCTCQRRRILNRNSEYWEKKKENFLSKLEKKEESFN